MPRIISTVSPGVRWVLLALAILPCGPGLTFLLAGWVRDPRRAGPAGQVEYERRSAQADALYRAGEVAAGAGALCGLAVAWTVIRRRDDGEEEQEGRGPAE